METFTNTLRSIVLLIAMIFTAFGSSIAIAQPPPQDARYMALQIGITESAVIQIMETQPVEVRRATWAGIEKTTFVFDVGGQRYTIDFIGARLVSKSVETKPSRWSLF